MKKIVIIPCFAEAHFTELQIDNLVNNINPDIIIYNEGLFPTGPEGKGGVDNEFCTEFCYGDTNLAWDTLELQSKIQQAQLKYPNIRIIWNHMSYDDIQDPNQCYVAAVSNFDVFDIKIEPGDLIFPLEGDVFFHYDDVQLLNEYINGLDNDSGLQAPYLDFIENQYYVEGDSLDANKIHKRRIVIKFGTWEYYSSIVSNFTSQQYPQLQLFPRYIFHYAWWRPNKYKELRFKQLVRPKYYSDAMRAALQQATEAKLKQIVMRPDRDERSLSRYIVHIDIDHPIEITKHTNYIKHTKVNYI
jgi:hypothetical protein